MDAMAEAPALSRYAVHDAAELGDVETLARLLAPVDGLGPDERPPWYSSLHRRDREGCTPLHVALLHAQLDCVRLLLEAGASPTAPLEGSPPLHLAVCAGGLEGLEAFALSAARLLLACPQVAPFERDDGQRTALHWAAHLGLPEICGELLAASEAWVAREETEAGGLEAGKSGAATQVAMEVVKEKEPTSVATEAAPSAHLPSLLVFTDRHGDAPLHLAALAAQPNAVVWLLAAAGARGLDVPVLLSERNRAGETALHCAALSGCSGSAAALLWHAGDAIEALARAQTRLGATAASLASDCRFRAMEAMLCAVLGDSQVAPDDGWEEAARDIARASTADEAVALALRPGKAVAEAASAASAGATKQVLIIAPPECWEHRTAPAPAHARGSSEPPPPENTSRLAVCLGTRPGQLHASGGSAPGALRSRALAPLASWDERPGRCLPAADALRVHDWAYLARVKNLCDEAGAAGDDQSARLDGDTSLGALSWTAALAAAQAGCDAVDAVLRGRARAVFCAVRPPGHHAGPLGGVGSDRDPVATTGFCLINNVVVAAAYALNVHRELVRRVAILDFDVHHGNGTEACVGATVPSVRSVPFATPFSEGVQTFPVWRPWHSEKDPNHIFFASVQGFGVEEGPDTVFYPGSGATSDSVDPADEMARSAGVGDGHPAAPRVIDVGIPGGRPHVALWRRSWRDKILPELASFGPDLILISAGFDAHRKDVMNHCHIGVTERDYEWLTERIMQVANRCESHVVSMLEGGYRVQGGFASALARSVAAHVQVLAHPSRKCWSEEDSQKERDLEAAQRAEAAKKRAEAEAALAAQEAALEAGAEAEAGDRKRRRRGGGAVDYLALNAELDAENKATAQIS